MKDYRHCKQHKIKNATETIDHISNLPDCILHHILSFMPTKEVVKTSILSKRWKSLWASVANIDFDDASLYSNEMDSQHPPNTTSFMTFVDKILRSRDGSNIEKFRLSCRVCFNASTIRSWISNAVIHNVRELDLCLFTDDLNPSVILPKSMFDTTSLVTMKLEMNCVIEFPAHVSFPCLKTLNLSLVTFANDESLQKLFSGCPVLENLFLLDCEWMNLTNVVISSSSLKKLTIDDLPYFGPLDESNGCKIKIDAVNLVYFEYIGYLSSEIFLNDVSSLVKACVHIPVPHVRQKEVAFRAVDLLKGLQYVASLRVSTRTMESLICAGSSMLDRFPVFPNLSHLILTMEIGNYTYKALMDLLNFCPVLQSLCLSEGFESCIRLSEKDSIWLSIPICMSYRLKNVTFNNFHANDSEICFLKCVLKYSHVLENMNIGWCKPQLQDLKKQRDVKKELEMIETMSITCVVKFS